MHSKTPLLSLVFSSEIQMKAMRAIVATVLLTIVAALSSMAQVPEQTRAAIGAYRAAIGRRALLSGETVGREMGISTWIAFTGTDDHALAQGEFAATSDELQNLLKALRSKNFTVTSIRNHTAGEHPQSLFVRFWQQGRSVELARGLRYALNTQVGAVAAERNARRDS